MRASLEGLSRFIITPEVAKHRPFIFAVGGTIPDASLYAIGSDDAFVLGVLSSRLHVTWSLAAGGTLEDRPRYQNGPCFDPFPFPACTEAQKARIRDLGEQLEAHRKRQQALHPELTITGMYNVLEKLRSGEALSAKEKVIHEQGLVSVLKQIHDDLDVAVFDAYGWPHDLSEEQILEKLVALNAERANEERNGSVRWLRPEFQNPEGARAPTQEALLSTDETDVEEEPAAAETAKPWPKKLAEQISAVRDRVTAPARTVSVANVTAWFKGAKRKDVEDILDSLAALGVLTLLDTDQGKRWKPTARPAA